jgi:hypothetical protein
LTLKTGKAGAKNPREKKKPVEILGRYFQRVTAERESPWPYFTGTGIDANKSGLFKGGLQGGKIKCAR